VSNVNHISEEQFVMFYYGESQDSLEVERHLEQCETCRAEYRTLQQVLNTVNSAPMPERGPEYGRAVWQRIEGRLPKRRRFKLASWWIWAPAMAGLLVAAFLAGRLSHRADTPAMAANQVRERILLVAVGDHLERSQMVLAELSHSPDGAGKIDISDERERAEELLDDNRLYRETARNTGDTAMASVLDDLERVLIEISHSPTEMSSDQLEDLRQQIEERGLLFKVRVLGSQVRDRENTPMEPSKKKNRL
jgi:hypothetical protein